MEKKEFILHVDAVLPVIMPAGLDKVVPGYYLEVQDIDASQVLSESQIKAILLYSIYYCVLNHLLSEGYELQEITYKLDSSIDDVDCLEEDEKGLARKLITAFGNYRIIREGHPFDDWLCEVIWPIFRDDKYIYPSSMSGIISYGLNYKSIFERSDILMAQSE
tara:strand:+ start:905 stop:1393 length:489 start_codon:yes stop_codon:yes gene_type:complete